MACTITSTDFDAVIPDENDDICTKFLKYQQFVELFNRWYSECMFTENGELHDNLVDRICALDCVDGGAVTTVGTSGSIAEVVFNPADGEQEYIVPAGVTSLMMMAFGPGGGGGGGGYSATTPALSIVYGGGGGGGGGYAAGRISVTPGETLTIRVPSGGTAGGPSSAGTDGQQCYVKRGSTFLLIANGGRGGGAGSIGFAGGSGGSGGTGSVIPTATDISTDSGDNGSAGSLGSAGAVTGVGGTGGNSGGSGGSGGASTANGGAPGGGGGGGNTVSTGVGGNGGAAQVIFS